MIEVGKYPSRHNSNDYESDSSQPHTPNETQKKIKVSKITKKSVLGKIGNQLSNVLTAEKMEQALQPRLQLLEDKIMNRLADTVENQLIPLSNKVGD